MAPGSEVGWAPAFPFFIVGRYGAAFFPKFPNAIAYAKLAAELNENIFAAFGEVPLPDCLRTGIAIPLASASTFPRPEI